MSFKKETIGDVVELITNGVNCKQNKDGNGVKISRIETIANREINYKKTGFSKLTEADKNKYKLIKGDILFSHINSPIHVGKVAIYNGSEDLYHGVNLLKLRVKNHINPYYFKYFLDEVFQSGYWRRTSKQSVNQASVNQTDIKKIDFLYPILSEQKRIVAKLDATFAEINKIEKNTILNLDNINLFFKKSLGKIIENGEKKNLSGVADLIDSLHKTPKKYVEQGYPMVRVTDVKEGPLKFHKTKKVDKATFDEFTKRYTANIGDIVFSRVGSYGISSYVDSDESFCLGQNTVMIIPKINSKFLYYFLNSETAKSQLKEKVSGVTQPTVSLKSIKEIILKVPEKKIQEKIVLKMDSLYDYKNNLIRNYNHKISSLRKLRNSFMAELLNKNNSEIV